MALIIVTLLMYINDHLREVSKILDWVFMVLPNYCIAAAIKDLYLNFYNMRLCEDNPELASYCEYASPCRLAPSVCFRPDTKDIVI